MKLKQSILNKKRHGDIQLITKETGISRTTISNCLKYGEGSLNVVNKIENYYAKK